MGGGINEKMIGVEREGEEEKRKRERERAGEKRERTRRTVIRKRWCIKDTRQ